MERVHDFWGASFTPGALNPEPDAQDDWESQDTNGDKTSHLLIATHPGQDGEKEDHVSDRTCQYNPAKKLVMLA